MTSQVPCTNYWTVAAPVAPENRARQVSGSSIGGRYLGPAAYWRDGKIDENPKVKV